MHKMLLKNNIMRMVCPSTACFTGSALSLGRLLSKPMAFAAFAALRPKPSPAGQPAPFWKKAAGVPLGYGGSKTPNVLFFPTPQKTRLLQEFPLESWNSKRALVLLTCFVWVVGGIPTWRPTPCQVESPQGIAKCVLGAPLQPKVDHLFCKIRGKALGF